jgi:DNA polymerase V
MKAIKAKLGRKPTIGLTKAQERVIFVIKNIIAEQGIPPTMQEIADTLKISCPSVYEHIHKLVDKGVLRHTPRKSRSIEIILDSVSNQLIPLYSHRVPAGFPSPADDFIESYLDLNEHLIKHPAATFFVRAEGTSMINAGIHHGDMLVVDRSIEPTDGAIVIAVVNGELTVKRLKKNAGRVWLMPENPDFKPMEITEEMEVIVWGVVKNSIHDL